MLILVSNSFLFLVVRPGAPVASLLLVAIPGAPSICIYIYEVSVAVICWHAPNPGTR